MSTLNYNGNEYTILYIDANIGSSAGDGSTPSTALANIPSTLADKTCYIIRRQENNETTYIDFPQSWYASLYYIMFLGMPKSTDPMYNLMETSAKTLWGSDTGDYARIRCNMSAYVNNDSWSSDDLSNTNNKTLFKTNSVRNFYASNCYFYRDGNSGSQNSSGNRFSYMFGFDYSTRFADIMFNNCKFGYTQYNIDNSDYISSNSDVSTDTTSYPQYKCQSYIAVRSCNSVTLNKCIINHVFTTTTINTYTYYFTHGVAKCIYMTNVNKLVFTNSQYNILYRNSVDGSNSRHENTNHIVLDNVTSDQVGYNTASERSKAVVENIEINRIYTQTGARIDCQNLRVDAYDVIADNIKVNHKVMGGGTLTSWNNLMTNGHFIQFQGTNSYKVSNVYVNLNGSNLQSAKVLKIYSINNYVGNPKASCENIYIKLDPSGTLNMGGPITYFYRNRIGFNVSDDEKNVDTNSTFTTNSEVNHVNIAQSSIISNMVVDAPNTTEYAVSCKSFGFKSPYIRGRVYLADSTADIKKHYNNISNYTGALVYGSSYYKCDDYEANLSYSEYTGEAQVEWQPNGRASVYINKSNCILYNELPVTTTYLASSNNFFVCPNYIKTGQFFQRNEVCFAKSWNTVRTGSSSQGSLRFNNNYGDVNNNSYPLIVGCEPYTGIQITPSSIGSKILTAYIAIKNMDASELGYTGRLGIHVNCPETYTDYYDSEKTDTRNHLYTSEGIGWQTDTSTWSGDTNLSRYKCEIPIEVFTLTSPIDVKIWFNWYSVNGYLYIDPDFKLTDVS